MKDLKGLNILIVEDDPTVRLLLKKSLENKGSTVSATAAGAHEKALEDDLDIIVLDLNLPDGNGYDICEYIREQDVTTPVLVLSAEQETDMKVKVLNVGADDYLTKPFSVDELQARIEAILRRSNASTNGSIQEELKCKDLKVDVLNRKMVINSEEIDLTNSEYNLLAYLVKNKGRTISQDELAKNVWGIDFNTQTNYINVYVSYLRKKMRKHTDFEYIRTVRKKGFKVVCD